MSWSNMPLPSGFRRTRRAVNALTMLVCVGLSAFASSAFASAPTAACPSSYDAETAPESTLQACGDKVYPLLSVSPVAGGGKAYYYETPTMGVTTLVPPASFNPANASTAELKTYGIPPEPEASSPEHSMWEQMIHNMHYQAGAPSARLVVSHSTTGARQAGSNSSLGSSEAGAQTSHNWSGYGNYASTQAYNKSAAYWVEPSPVATCFGAQEVNWAGLGGWNSTNLAQNGTANGFPEVPEHKAWWEILPAGIVGIPMHGTAGYYFEAQTLYEGYWEGRSHFDFYWYDYAEGAWYADQVWTTNGVDRSTSEFIVERPTEQHSNGLHYLKPLEDYTPITMQGFTEGHELASYPYNYTTMERRESPHTILATVAGIPPSSYLFTDTFHNCGGEEYAGY